MTNYKQNNISNSGAVNETGSELYIDPELVVKRVNALIVHASEIEGADPAESKAREITAHLKNLKEIEARNHALKSEQDKKAYSRYEDLPAPHPDDIANFRRKLKDILARYAIPDPGDRPRK